MKLQLISGMLVASSAMSLYAMTPQSQLPVAKAKAPVEVVSGKCGSSTSVNRNLAPGVVMTVNNGIKQLRLTRNTPAGPLRMPAARQIAPQAKLPEGLTLFESFEDWDGSEDWTPKGWTVDMRGEVERAESWTIATGAGQVTVPDGKYMYAINYSADIQDEWLISPLAEVKEGMSLSYMLYIYPLYLYSLDNVDWDKMAFEGPKQIAATLQIWVQPEGSEWTQLLDYADKYANYSLDELLEIYPMGLEKQTVSLEEYIGKKIKVAFRYVGIDGNTMFIDKVAVGYPSLEGISYMSPSCTLFWGFEKGWELSYIPSVVAQFPSNAPLTWINYSDYNEAVTYEWTFEDPATGEPTTSSETPDDLTLTYLPDLTDNETMRNNLHASPVLTASAPFTASVSYQDSYKLMQMGGRPEFIFSDNSEFNGSLLPFDFINRGIGRLTVDDEKIGDMAIPVFGYNCNVNQYWLNYSLGGEDYVEGDYARLEGIANLFFASSDAPIVVNGVNVYGWGLLGDDVEFTATIYGLNAEMSTDYTTFTTIAQAKIKGSDVIREDLKSNGNICLPFEFESPVVLQAGRKHPAFVVMFEGFNNDANEYFAPFQSVDPDPNYMCFGYQLTHIDMSNHVDRDPYWSFKAMVYKDGDDYVDPYGAFAIALDAEYPWLSTDCEGILLADDVYTQNVKLASFYDGSRLSVEAPEGIEATVAGRFADCVLTVTHSDPTKLVDGNIVVKGPAVELTIPVKADLQTGIDSIIVSPDEAGDPLYDLTGRRINNPAKGIYLKRNADGTTSKVQIR